MRLPLRAPIACAFALLIAVAPLAARSAAVRTAGVFGERIAYIDVGTGPAVVLVHGLADDLGVWHDTIAALAPHHRVIALDLLGFGKSAKPLVEYRAATEADVLDGLLARLHVTHATVVGNSLGGWVATLLAVRRPARVARLVLVDAIARGDDALDPVLSAVRVPTLIIWGRGDRLIPLTDGVRFRAAIRGARFLGDR